MGGTPQKLEAVPLSRDPEVVQALEKLLARARAGEVIGLAYVAMMPAHEYEGDSLGAALQHPVMALGLARALEDQIIQLLR